MRCRPIDLRERRLARKGPVWRTPMAFDVLRNLPFLRHVPARAVEVRPLQPFAHLLSLTALRRWIVVHE
jgi:hypothetical protein